MIHTHHAPTLRGLHLLANHPTYALTLEDHEIADGSHHFVVSLHKSSPLSMGEVASLTRELLTLRLCFANTRLYVIEATPDDKDWESFVALFGFVPFQGLPCTDGCVRRLFISPAITGKATA